MPAASFRFEPLGVDLFPLGTGPFRARGVAYADALRYVDTKLRGGRTRFLEELGTGDPFAPYFDQIFLVTGDYDASPLMRLFNAVSRLEGVPVARFIELRSRWSADSTTRGIWKPLLKVTSPEIMAGNLYHAFNRFFQPCRAEKLAVSPGQMDYELSVLPEPMAGLFTSSTIGFVSEAIELAGGKGCRVEMAEPEAQGALEGVPTVKVRFVATWK